MNTEYTVIILPPSPHDAAKSLNKLAKEGWKVVAVAFGDRVILEREHNMFPLETLPLPSVPQHLM